MFARTPRLLLRPGWMEDAPALAAAISDEAIIRNLARAPWPYRIEDAEAFLAPPRDPSRPDALVFARTLGTPRLVGGVALLDGEDGDAALGYWIARSDWGLGYASEAARAMLAFAFGSLRLPRVIAGHFIDNPASGRVLRKLGFKPVGGTGLRYSRGRGAAALHQRYAIEAPWCSPCLLAA